MLAMFIERYQSLKFVNPEGINSIQDNKLPGLSLTLQFRPRNKTGLKGY
jgi:hypothetical protein